MSEEESVHFMNYRELYREANEQAAERFLLMEERIGQIASKAAVPEPFADYFERTAAFLQMLAQLAEEERNGALTEKSLAECGQCNQALYADVMPEAYGKSYGNPDYAAETLGETFAPALSLLYAHIRKKIREVYRGNLLNFTAAMELFVEIYNCFERMADGEPQEELEREIHSAVYWYFHDYSEMFYREMLRRQIDPAEDFETDIVRNADLQDLRYLYRYGAYIGEDERGVAAFLNGVTEQEIQKMADTYTEGYRIGFEVTGKDLSKKKTVQIRYPIGFERVVRAAVRNFEKMNLQVTMAAEGIPVNRQFEYDHREDRAYYVDKAYVERCLEVRKNYFEEVRGIAAGMAGPAVIEVFGEKPFSPEQRQKALQYNEKQRQLCVYEVNMAGQIQNRYIKGEERSFTLIAWPVPSIGPKFAEIFAKTVEINTLDYALYRDVQQKIIDALDEAERVHVTGKGANRTDIYISIWKLLHPERETAFENCVADVNIPVGEVFTSPVLAGTEGKLFVSRAYLRGFCYENLEIDFIDGMVCGYDCTNFEDEAANRKYIQDNLLMRHETLPMGEFAIGTNTLAYRMARDFAIADKLPILIAEKTGPHFAVGDTCYKHEEDNISYNPDGKAIVARENAVSALRREDVGKAYYNCHTDITIPYDELDRITVIRKDGSTTDIIADGKFVLAGTQVLNGPLEP